ncbi:MAG: ABC transporter substrate-binding protein [Proteobacteria bacterium]|nr:ABC transporter substrate-binding protein [Pseudomonadota bacterium]MBU1715010.1 ABC transporter substrate-binding protein [Pseudomonadota bacterium]
MMRKITLVFILLIITVTMACSPAERRAQERAERAKSGQGDILIAAVWDFEQSETLFDEGVKLATDEINQGGGVLGRKLRVEMHNAPSSEMALKVARRLVKNPDIVAVVGHDLSSGAIPASVVYEKSGMLFVSAGATSPLLTSHGFNMVFRNIPSDRQTGAILADFAVQAGLKKVAVIDDETVYGRLLAESFLEHAHKVGMEIKMVKSYFLWQTNFKLLASEIKSAEVDAVFLGAILPLAAEVISQIREMGIEAPILAGDGLDSPTLWKIAGEASEGTIVSTVFNTQSKDEITRKFVSDFTTRFGIMPDTWAAQGYDVVKLLADSFTLAKSTVPIVVSSYMRFMVSRHGVTGSYSFSEHGDIVGKEMFFKKVTDGKFQYLDAEIKDSRLVKEPQSPPPLQ